jgi:peroxiredoxin family protein
VLEVAEHFKKLKEKKMKLSAAATAMAEGNFVFVYLTTYANVFFDIEKYENNNKNLVIMNKTSTQTLLGICWDFYSASRVAVATNKNENS